MSRGYCLVSQDIEKLVFEGKLEGDISNSNIQPSSFEPTIGNEVFILDTDSGLFRPRADRSVLRNLLELPARKRVKRDISDGFELKIGGSYLFPLMEKIKPANFNFIKSSPKSSIGRVFPSTRFMTDFNPSFDEATYFPKGGLDSWLLVQPKAFNLIVGPGLSFNQLRFFKGYDSALSPKEIIDIWKKDPLLYPKGLEGRLERSISPRIAEALQLHLDLEGRGSEGIVALRARRNPDPVDLRQKGGHVAEAYFEPIKPVDGKIVIKPGEHYLMPSKEVLSIPKDLNAELRAHSHQGIRGTLHEAGFIDNGFTGDLVFEITSEEATEVHLYDGTPIGELIFYRTSVPDKLYGEEIGSNYAGQVGPKVSKYFTGFDYSSAAKNHVRLNRDVLVQDRRLLTDSCPQGFNFLKGPRKMENLFNITEAGFFHSRYDCEDDGLVVQPIPYIVLFDGEGRVFSYVRAGNEKKDGDARLFGKSSVGLGGHIQRGDFPDYIRNCVNREIEKDVYVEGGTVSRPKFLGTLNCTEREVDSYHFGFVFGAYVNGDVHPRDLAMFSGGMVPIKDMGDLNQYETWSRTLIPYLSDIEKRVLGKK